MRNVTKAFRRVLWEDRRNWLPYVDITLADGTKLPQFTKETLWTSGLSFEAAVSEDDRFTAVGAAIMGAATVVIDNIGEKWNDYDFTDADVNIKLGLEVEGTPEILQIGRYTVDSAVYNGAVVTLSLLDYMYQLDRVYDTPLNYPATLGSIVSDACKQCGVSLAPNYTTFPHYDYRVETKPSSDNTTYRDVIAWAAQIAGCFAVFNANGRLELKWFGGENLQKLREGYDGGEFDAANPYATGDKAEGGSFNPWNLGAELDGGVFTEDLDVHYISSLFTENISLDDTVITGVQVTAERETDGDRETVTGFAGSTGYVISLEGNKLISPDDVQAIATWVGPNVIGLTFRKSRATHLSDPSIEAGDVALLLDHKGREYPILVTRTRFTTGGRQETVCGSETPARNRSKQFSQETKNYVNLQRQLKETKDSWDLAEDRLRQDIVNSNGLYETDVEQEDGSVKKYYHNKKTLEESDIVMTFNDRGFMVTSDYNAKNPEESTWYGLNVNGELIAEILYAHKLFAENVLTGRIQDEEGINFWDLVTGEIRITNATKVGEDNTIGDLAVECDVEYGLSSSSSTTPTTWTTNASWEHGKYLWTRVKYKKSDGSYDYSPARRIANDYGIGFKSVKEQYYLSTSDKGLAGGSWSDSQPAWVSGRFYWTRSEVEYSDGTIAYTDPVLAGALTSGNQSTDNLDSSLNQKSIFDRLTNNGKWQGLYSDAKTGNYYLNVSYAAAGELSDKDRTNWWNLETGEFHLGANAKSENGLATSGDLADLVTACVAEYCRTDTSTAPSATDSSWGATVTWQKGKYLWSHIKTTYQNGDITRTSAELVGWPDGVGVSKVETLWLQTTSKTSVPATNNGSWSTTMPSYVYGRYIWTMSRTTYTDGSTDTTTPVLANSLNDDAEATFNRLTNGGTTQGIYRQADSNGVYKLYVNASWIGAGVLKSNDSNENFRLDLATGQMTMKKGSINLGEYTENGTKKYNFTVNDSGQVAIKKGSIDLGDDSTYGFHVSTAGRLSWKATNSSMDNTGLLSLTGATIKGGKISMESGKYVNQLRDGYLYCYYNGTEEYIGKVGTSLFSNGYRSMAIDIGVDAKYGGFAVQSTAGYDASLAFYYDRNADNFTSTKNIYTANHIKCSDYDSTDTDESWSNYNAARHLFKISGTKALEIDKPSDSDACLYMNGTVNIYSSNGRSGIQSDGNGVSLFNNWSNNGNNCYVQCTPGGQIHLQAPKGVYVNGVKIG